MKVNGDAIYETKASPFKNLEWGPCTQKAIDGGVRLYLHVFNWPANRKLVVPGILNEPKIAYLLADREQQHLLVRRQEDAIVIDVPEKAPDSINSVVVLDVRGNVDVTSPPRIGAKFDIFIDGLDVNVTSEREKVDNRYTLDGSVPSASSTLVAGPIRLTQTTTVTARCFREGNPVSGPVSATFTKMAPNPATEASNLVGGVKFAYYEGDWNVLPDFSKLKPVKEGVAYVFDISPRNQPEYFGLDFNGFLKVAENGVYSLSTESDDGSRLFVDGKLVVDNDGLHSSKEVKGVVALAAGAHPIRVQYFQKGGGRDLKVSIEGPKGDKQVIPGAMLFYQK
jgi:hypothetical protein